jgi:type IV pilus assembly protein PilV
MAVTRERGFTLIEFLVTLVLVAVGLLGVAGIQARAAALQKDSVDRKAASALCVELAERMRANHLGYMAGDYVTILPVGATPAVTVAACATSQCTPAELSRLDLATWLAHLESVLPGAGVNVSFAPTGATIVVAWIEPDNGANSNDNMVGSSLDCTAAGLSGSQYRCFTAEVINP